MAEVLPQIQVTSSQPGDIGSPRVLVQSPSPDGDVTKPIKDVKIKNPVSSNAKSGKPGPPPKLAKNPSARANTLPQSPPATGGQQTAIDPLSQHILKRTQTDISLPQRLRTNTSDNTTDTTPSTPTTDAGPSRKRTLELQRGDESLSPKEKKKGVSFLSRFIGAKRKPAPEEPNDDESEQGDPRIEGMDAHVFSQPIQSSGYIPQHLMPPSYIKVRAHNKKEREFNRVFLAQELQCRREDKTGQKLAETLAATGGAVWATEFSKDGKYMAAGGQDRIVRVWSVISTPEERQAHEREEDATLGSSNNAGVRLSAPVFKTKPTQEYEGHTADILDLSWSKNNFLLSSSMDKTVRLWHISRSECLCCFKHSDFVTSIAFHPRDDRFFLAGSLDSKLRLWSIPDKSIAFWNQLPDLITAVAFTPDGKTCVAGCLNGQCLFYDTEGLKYNTQIHVRSSHGRNAKGSKITGIQAIFIPPNDPNGDIKILVTSNDSRVRLYNFRDKSLEMKFRSHENTCSQIRASFSDDAHYVICGSEDRKAYIWSTSPVEGEKKDRRPLENFTAHTAIVTTAILAPTKTRQLLNGSGDPLYDLCNPPPITLVSRSQTQSHASSKPNLSDGKKEGESSVPPTPGTPDTILKSYLRADEPASSGYLLRATHMDGNIIVTADYVGRLKVFRQDCAFQKRRNDSWDATSAFSKKLGNGLINRTPSIATKGSSSTTATAARQRDSFSGNSPSDRIHTWRNSISNTSLDGSVKNDNYSRNRSVSPRKSLTKSLTGRNKGFSISSSRSFFNTDQNQQQSPSNHSDLASSPSDPHESQQESYNKAPPVMRQESDPLLVGEGGQSLLFWNTQQWPKGRPQLHSNWSSLSNSNRQRDSSHLAPISRQESRVSRVSRLSSEEDDDDDASSAGGHSSVGDGDRGLLKCRKCGATNFRAKRGGRMNADTGDGRRKSEQTLVCAVCGTVA